MEDERHASEPNMAIKSPESPSSEGNHNINRDQDRFLPIANVGRIMKKVIPGNGKISKDAKETVQECVSEFISFVTGEASDKCQREKRKTINGDDILWAITILGFDDYVNPLKYYLNKYREVEGERINVPKQLRVEQQQQKRPIPPEKDQASRYVNGTNNIYSSTNLMPQPPYVSNDQPYPLLAFRPQNPFQTQLHQQEHFDSAGQW
ncbi:hypothetical protein RJ640_001450 [Escallonia rubra]|uniref:Transcription factor CBF/NF-Y/archaeal histone domain-containing protein n=1 Tax=Escallonia rubra TaxID=112253 RepID=A0AA88R7Q7_9ASTE|nr:hypothetical protein RJ640_001450 [Escallonia rubra]